jgi:predicted amidohydrolase
MIRTTSVLGAAATILFFALPGRAADTSLPTKSLRIALVQMALRPTLEGNRDRIVRGIGEAADKGARVAVFPERALTGQGGEQVEPVEQAVERIRQAARDKKIYVVSGAHTYRPSVKRNANWMFAIGPDGKELMRYEKLYDNHRAKMPGVFNIDGVPANTAICADRWLRGVVELPIQQGSQIFFELSNNYACEWVEPYGWYWNAPLARRNTVWSIFCNSANEAPGQISPGEHLKHGHSAIIAPDGRVVAGTNSDDEQLVIADIQPHQATREMTLARGHHPALQAFWEAGIKLQQGESVSAPEFKPLKSPAVDITLAAAAVPNHVQQMLSLIAEAKGRQADLIAFPAQAIDEGSLSRLQIAAHEHQICVAVGARHKSAGGERNSAFVIGPDGHLLTRYDQLSATAPFQPGNDPAAMWFRIKGVPAVVTLENDALWNELSELAAVAGARIHIHLDRAAETDAAGQSNRLQAWVTSASFQTFTATVSDKEAMLWDDLQAREESRSQVKGTPLPDSGKVEVLSFFSANLVERAGPGALVVAKRKVPASNNYHPNRTANMNPQMKAWYELGAMLISPR